MSTLFETLSAYNGTSIGIATLASERNLNALNLPMAQALDQQLRNWQSDPNISCVLLRGSGDKAFCAGGDVRALIEQQRTQPQQLHPLAADFFATEYRLDYLIHHYQKPIIVWAHGHVMGGGMGLMQGARFRIVTPQSQLSMPEINIGLYPDAGGSWFLNQLPKPMGLFFGLTASRLNAADALTYQLADYLLAHEQQADLINALLQADLSQADALSTLLKNLEQAAQLTAPASQWPARQARISQLMDHPQLPAIYQALCQLAQDADPLLATAGNTLAAGSTMSAWLTWQQLKRSQNLSFGQCLQMEYSMSLACCLQHDFSEGVRAKLIEKDNQPNWQWPQLELVPPALIEAHFTHFADQPNPLADLL